MHRSILHVDMDAFFASVEQLDSPELRGKPVIVGWPGKRGVVCAASYEARPFGCRSAQPMSVARRLCPQAVVVEPRGSRYRELSDRVFDVLQSFTPLVEPVSIDEAFLDVTGSIRLFGSAHAIAASIRERIRAETGLTASVGVAPNKFLAKLASEMNKPDGLTVIEPHRVRDVLAPLPVGAVFGVGPRAQLALGRLGVRTVGQLRELPAESLTARFGSFGGHMHRLARGEDDGPVTPDHGARSIGHEQTFGDDVEDAEAVRRVLLGHAEHVARRLRRHGRHARTVTVKIRYGEFETVTRADTLPEPTDRTDHLCAAAANLFDRWAGQSFRPVRLIGVTASNLTEAAGGEQLDLFTAEQDERRRRVDRTTDVIVERFGKGAIRRGTGAR